MKVHAYLILVPGADRPYFSHHPPVDFAKPPGAKVYEFDLDVPDFFEADGVIKASPPKPVTAP